MGSKTEMKKPGFEVGLFVAGPKHDSQRMQPMPKEEFRQTYDGPMTRTESALIKVGIA
jgi:hypothetical protein